MSAELRVKDVGQGWSSMNTLDTPKMCRSRRFVKEQLIKRSANDCQGQQLKRVPK